MANVFLTVALCCGDEPTVNFQDVLAVATSGAHTSGAAGGRRAAFQALRFTSIPSDIPHILKRRAAPGRRRDPSLRAILDVWR
jgi:hypothetical protein